MSSTPPVMLGLELPDLDRWSERVGVILGQNPGTFTGPGTNTYLIGTGRRRLLLDTGDGRPAYLPIVERALEEAGCELEGIVVTHGHPDHVGGVAAVRAHFGSLPVYKHPWPEVDAHHGLEFETLADGDRVHTEGATLRAVHTPGHACDHLCFVLEEEAAIFTGDNVLGVGTTVIPARGGDLGEYLRSLERIEAEGPGRIYPAHGPLVADGVAKVREYIAHRLEREAQILDALDRGAESVTAIVEVVYAAYPRQLHAAAGQSVTAHLLKLERERRVSRQPAEHADPLSARWHSK